MYRLPHLLLLLLVEHELLQYQPDVALHVLVIIQRSRQCVPCGRGAQDRVTRREELVPPLPHHLHHGRRGILPPGFLGKTQILDVEQNQPEKDGGFPQDDAPRSTDGAGRGEGRRRRRRPVVGGDDRRVRPVEHVDDDGDSRNGASFVVAFFGRSVHRDVVAAAVREGGSGRHTGAQEAEPVRRQTQSAEEPHGGSDGRGVVDDVRLVAIVGECSGAPRSRSGSP
mmetsp:Transcript_2058/g.5422  ORF Transcript_2058/g.5422 Transcript_2058/m.5422 type:complete len:225 (-) Transcript_2058:2155-2829(-)